MTDPINVTVVVPPPIEVTVGPASSVDVAVSEVAGLDATIVPPTPVDVDVAIVVGPPGPPGDQHVFVQQTQPSVSGSYVWFQLNADGTLRSLWVEDGMP